jgi:uncharacterized protein YprB with RNaseH-like and TPR domain
MSSLADRLRGIVRPGSQPGGSAFGGTRPTEGWIENQPVSARAGHDDAADTLGGQWCDVAGQRFLVIDRRYLPDHRHGWVAMGDALPPGEGIWPRLPVLAGESCAGRMLFVDLETTGLAGGAGSYAFLVGCAWFETPSAAAQPELAGFETPSAAAQPELAGFETPSAAAQPEPAGFETPSAAAQPEPAGFETPSAAAQPGSAGFERLPASGRPGQAGVFRTRQFFLSSFAAERALLAAVAHQAAAAGVVVTYNGKSFDLPLIETRYLLHRMQTPFAEMPHVDLLHPARRLWGGGEEDEEGGARGGRCRLTSLEQALCGHQRTGDVPGFEIPSRYFHYVRSGDAAGLAAVMEHNRLDLLSLAVLTARASRLLDDGPEAARTAREALGAGRLYARAALHDEARAAYLRAASLDDADPLVRADALRACALSWRRERRYAEAADCWRRIVEARRCPPHIRREAVEALAVHHEHRLRDPRAARSFAVESMSYTQTRARREALEHRLNRLDRKLADAAPGIAPLF